MAHTSDKAEIEKGLTALQAGAAFQDMPASLESYSALIKLLTGWLGFPDPDDIEARDRCRKIVQRLIHRIDITKDRIKIHYHVGKDHLERELKVVSSLSPSGEGSASFFERGSCALTNGGHR